ncbi:MAG: SRPBCC family protein [Myxococcaceae bacterium]
MKFQSSIDIAVSPEVVFTFLSTHENHSRFIRENIESKQLSPGPMGVGTDVRNVASFMGMRMVEDFTITEFEPNRRLAKRSREGSTVETTDTFDLERTPTGTRVHLTVTGKLKGARGLFFRLLAPILQKSFDRTLKELKRILEAEKSA